MKLIYCPKCKDVFSLISKRRDCSCGKSWGWTDNGTVVSYCGKAILFSIDGSKLDTVLQGLTDTSFRVGLLLLSE